MPLWLVWLPYIGGRQIVGCIRAMSTGWFLRLCAAGIHIPVSGIRAMHFGYIVQLCSGEKRVKDRAHTMYFGLWSQLCNGSNTHDVIVVAQIN